MIYKLPKASWSSAFDKVGVEPGFAFPLIKRNPGQSVQYGVALSWWVSCSRYPTVFFHLKPSALQFPPCPTPLTHGALSGSQVPIVVPIELPREVPQESASLFRHGDVVLMINDCV